MLQGAQEHQDRGETLVEVLVTVVILGLAGVAMLAGLQLTVKSADLGRKQASGGSYVRSWAEKIQNAISSSSPAALPTCGTAAASYKSIGDAVIAADSANLSGYTAALAVDATQTQQIMSWNGTAWGACAAGAPQRVKLKLTSPGTGAHRASETLTLILRQPCSGPVPGPGNLAALPC